MTIDRETILWLVSTAPQVLAALTALSLAAMIFIVGSIDEQISRDDTLKEVLGNLKKDLYRSFKWVIISSISIIAIDLLLICCAEWIIDCHDRLIGLLIIFYVLHFICLFFLCGFTMKLVDPQCKQRVIDNFLKDFRKGTGKIDSGTFILHFRELEGKLRELFRKQESNMDNRKPLTTYEIIRGLAADNSITKAECKDLLELNRLRNFVVHDSGYQSIDKIYDDKLQQYIQIIKNLQE